MTTSKFMGEQGPEHEGPLIWPGLHGLPVRSRNIPMLRDEEYDDSYEVAQDFKFKEFDLTNPEHSAEYTKVMDRIVNGWYVQLCKEPFRDSDGHRKVYLEWTQRYGLIRAQSSNRSPSSGSSIQRVG